ncbi:MAG: class I SAM-dependent methyltransferase [Patescibacteria group bacterium]|nr:class I SAM-dependent methyltransferase [Patescibacteria group bacterium]MCX7589913.1 class I SAM-dependent methyltransferase [Patescibacteria group bacterium]MDW8279593.1 class I SAM-dependent methyltransferase [bacterium]
MIWLLFIFLIIIFLLYLFFIIFALDNLIFSHDLPTSNKAILKVIEIIKKYNPQASNFYDLGCGRGKVVLKIKKEFPNLNVYGVDKNKFRIFISKLKSLIFRKKINFINKNIFDLDLSKADIVYTYLWYDLMPILETKLRKELKSGAIVITNTSFFSNWQPKEIVNTWENISDPNFEKLFIYQKN